MKNFFFIVDKIFTSIFLLIIIIDFLPSLDIPWMAYFIPLIIMGVLRMIVVAIVIILDLISWINEKIKNIRIKN